MITLKRDSPDIDYKYRTAPTTCSERMAKYIFSINKTAAVAEVVVKKNQHVNSTAKGDKNNRN